MKRFLSALSLVVIAEFCGGTLEVTSAADAPAEGLRRGDGKARRFRDERIFNLSHRRHPAGQVAIFQNLLWLQGHTTGGAC
jgi:hypothetical protein